MADKQKLTYASLVAPLNVDEEPAEHDKLPLCVTLCENTIYACNYSLADWSLLRTNTPEGMRQLVRVVVVTRVEAARQLGICEPDFDRGLEPVIEAMESYADDD